MSADLTWHGVVEFVVKTVAGVCSRSPKRSNMLFEW